MKNINNKTNKKKENIQNIYKYDVRYNIDKIYKIIILL